MRSSEYALWGIFLGMYCGDVFWRCFLSFSLRWMFVLEMFVCRQLFRREFLRLVSFIGVVLGGHLFECVFLVGFVGYVGNVYNY
jgi:hypothetical protein